MHRSQPVSNSNSRAARSLAHARWRARVVTLLAQRELALRAELALLRAGKLYRWVCKEKLYVGFAREMRAG